MGSDFDCFIFEDFSQDTDSMVMFTSQLRGTAGKVPRAYFSLPSVKYTDG